MRLDKVLREYVEYNSKALIESSRDLRSIFEIMFRDNGLVIAETEINYRIRKYSYEEVRTMIECASSILYEKIGASHSYVALEMENCIEWIVAFWAILRSGNKPYLVNCRHPNSLSQSIIDSLGIKTIVGLGSSELRGDFVDFGLIYSRTLTRDFLWDDIGTSHFENELAISTSATSMHQSVCFYTGAEITVQILDSERIIEECPRIGALYHGQLKQLAFLPFYHIFGLFAVFFWFGFYGRTFVFLKNFSPDTITRTCRRHEVTHIFAVPALWHTVEKKIIQEVSKYPARKQRMFWFGLKLCTSIQNVFPYWGAKASKYIMGEVVDAVFGPSIQFCISGGSYLKNSTLRLFNGIGYPLHNGYGMSEIGITSVELRARPRDRNRNSVGHSVSSIDYRISDEGTLEVRGASISNRVMIDGEVVERGEWFDTRDVVTREGEYYYVSGRAKDIIIGDNGENINPDVVERMFEIPNALNYCCYGSKRAEGEILALVVQIDKNIDKDRANSIYSRVLESNRAIPSSMRVKKFFFTYDPIMASTAVKVGRPYLTKGIEDGSIKLIPMKEFVPAVHKTNTALDEEVVSIVRDIIHQTLEINEDEIQVDSHIILDLGATSLQYFAILARISEVFGVETYSCSTIEEFVKYIEGQKI